MMSTCNKALQYHPHQTATWVRNYPSCVKPHFGIGLLQQLVWITRWIQLVCAVISLWSHCGSISSSGKFTPTCVIANAINYQADAQGLALHLISLFQYVLERKAGIVKDPKHCSFPQGSTHMIFSFGFPYISFWQVSHSIDTGWSHHSWHFPSISTSYFSFYLILIKIAVSLRMS